MSKKSRRARQAKKPDPKPDTPPQPVTPTKPGKPGMKINPMAIAVASAKVSAPVSPWTLPRPAPGVAPDNAGMAMDDAFGGLYGYAGGSYGPGVGFLEGMAFPGYPVLSEWALRAENRRLVSTLAQEMTRKFIRLTSTGDDNKKDTIAKIEAAMVKFRVQDVLREAAEHDGYFGIGHIFLDMGVTDPNELKTPLLARPEKIKKGSLKGIRTIEPVWCYPGTFNSSQPLRPDFYKPQIWYVFSQEIHHTRLLSLVSREVPDLLKPSRMFGGVALTELAKPTVDNWLETRKAVNDLLRSFTVWQLKTNLQATLAGGGGEEMLNRAQLFNQFRDNRGLMMLDFESEDLSALSASLAGLDHLQAQAQEHQAAVDGMPLIKLVGYTPSGLNSTGEGEMDSWRDRVRAQQEHLYNAPLKQILDVIQLSEFGSIDESIGFEWLPLEEDNEAEKAVIRKTDVDSAIELINAGVLHPEEERIRQATTAGSLYHGINVNDVPEPPADPTDPSLLPDPAKGAEEQSED